ncbi:uncharacterized protein LOC120359418 [Solenopsis invicta]|uniref:uncharacterized protein LOC120359418 n=1 Tax=Solenopsis invicta TaxID=13686 RepID=UPI00193D3131|nr:uncharacterized protein LOC120359418 [Solenopsis invicta]
MYAVVEFEDGLSVVPYKWLTQDLKEGFWPIYTSTARYDKAVKRMEEPESTWSKCSIRKIYGTYMTYDVARQKCKRAEEESDLTSNTEKDESRKRTRKNRAKKDMNFSASSNELSDDTSILDSMPKVPKFLNKVTHLKNTGNAQKSFDDRSYKRQSTKTMKNTASNNQSNVGKNDFHPSPVVSSGYIRPGGSRNYQIEEEEQDDLVSIESTERDEDNDVVLSPSLTSNEDARDKNVSKDEESCNDDDNDNVNASVMSLAGIKKTKVLGPNYNDGERKSNDSTRYVIRKLTNMEMKMNVMHTDIKNMKKQVAKLSTGTFETKERQKIDILQDLPLKDENDLEAMETKLKNNSSYRSEMVSLDLKCYRLPSLNTYYRPVILDIEPSN